MKYLFLIIFAFVALIGKYNFDLIKFSGVVKNNLEEKLVNVLVNIYSSDTLILSVRTSSKWEFNVSLPFDENYYICFNKLNHFEKRVVVEAKGVLSESLQPGFKFKQWVIFLQEKEDNIDPFYSISGGRIYYDANQRIFDWQVSKVELPNSLSALIKQNSKSLTNLASHSTRKNSPKNDKIGKLTEIDIEEYEQFSKIKMFVMFEDIPFSFKVVIFNYGEIFYFKNEVSLTEREFLRLFSKCTINKDLLTTFKNEQLILNELDFNLLSLIN